ncbi:hypothetical protein I2492_03165 [Budviciaceae bacterium CWB-B4]|uniref:Fucose-specific lectin n=1 Tax=Limnobaculum xujianqingii TaxID=2738837 RepID=A0A9D7AFZ1_9GAMM|nr:hypothetical protein [Limnobaculum xujianqingii]MBK5072018.1 hypothetical protein [Limnobaculum xujianqingii]MBK5175327.1 hypothetical protein [Limnobaculum xujianqingii]
MNHTFIHSIQNRSSETVQIMVLNESNSLSYDAILASGHSICYSDIFGAASLPVPYVASASAFTQLHIELRVGKSTYVLYEHGNQTRCNQQGLFSVDTPPLAGYSGHGAIDLIIGDNGIPYGEVNSFTDGSELTSISWILSQYALYGLKKGKLNQKPFVIADWKEREEFEQPACGLKGPLVAVSWAAGRYAIYALGNDNQIYEKCWLTSYWSNWAIYTQPTGVNLRHLSAVSWCLSQYAIHGVGDNGNLYGKTFYITSWKDWENMGRPASCRLTGPLTSVCWTPLRYGIYALGDDGKVWMKWKGLLWSEWTDIGSPSSPLKTLTSTSWLDRAYTIAGVAENGKLYARNYHYAWDKNWNDLGHPAECKLAGPVTAVSWCLGKYAFYAQGVNGVMYQLFEGKWSVVDGD